MSREAGRVRLKTHEVDVAPGAAGEATLRVAMGWAEVASEVSLAVRATSGREEATTTLEATGALSVFHAATPDRPRLWLPLGDDPIVIARAGETVTRGFDVWGDDRVNDPPSVVAPDVHVYVPR